MNEKRLYAKALASGRLTAAQAVCGLMRFYILAGYPMSTLHRDICVFVNAAAADMAIDRIWEAVGELERAEDDGR